MRSARRDLRKGHRRELPHLCDTAGEGLPRVYHMAWELIAHLDAQLDRRASTSFSAPTRPWPAEAGGTVVGLRHVAAGPHRIPLPRGDPCCSAAGRPGAGCGSQTPAPGSSLRTAPCPNEAADELSMKHGILSLRDLAMLDWKEFVERQSAVEHILREDPAGIHPRMSFASRDHYRQIVQRLARRSALDEEQVARAAIERARKCRRQTAGRRCVRLAAVRAGGRATVQQHVGYYLVDRGAPRWKPASVTAPRGCGPGAVRGAGPAGLLFGGDPAGVATHRDRRGGPGREAGNGADRRSGGRAVAAGALCRGGWTICGEPGELAVQPPGAAPADDALGFLGRNSRRASHAGGRTGAVDLRADGAGPRGAARTAVPGQSGRQFVVRPAERFSRCRSRNVGRRSAVAGAGPHGDRAAQRALLLPTARGSSTSCIGRGSGIGNRAHGWEKSGNGASWRP